MTPPVWWDVATLTITEAPRAEYTLGKDLNKSLHVPGNPAALEQSESIFNRDILWLVFHFAPCSKQQIPSSAAKNSLFLCVGNSQK